MITSTDELKALVLWMRAEKVGSFEVAGVRVSFASQAFSGEEIPESEIQKSKERTAREEEDLLFHSAS